MHMYGYHAYSWKIAQLALNNNRSTYFKPWYCFEKTIKKTLWLYSIY